MSAQLDLTFSPGGMARQKTLLRGTSDAGRLTELDLAAFNVAQRIAWDILKDGKPHFVEEFITATRQREAIRRVREVRKVIRAQTPGDIIAERTSESREFTYRYVERR